MEFGMSRGIMPMLKNIYIYMCAFQIKEIGRKFGRSKPFLYPSCTNSCGCSRCTYFFTYPLPQKNKKTKNMPRAGIMYLI